MQYKKILLKLSGETLRGQQPFGIDSTQLAYYTHEIHKVHTTGVQLIVVIGGGNIYRGAQALSWGLGRVQGDQIGMLATIMNGIALHHALVQRGVPARLLSSLPIPPFCETYIREKTLQHLEKGRIVLLSAGLGIPYVTTDTAASLRAIELGACVLLKGTKVDGIYTQDPTQHRTAVKFSQLTFQEAYQKKLQIMDATAFTLCEEHQVPLIVFDITKPDNLLKIAQGDAIGTVVRV